MATLNDPFTWNWLVDEQPTFSRAKSEGARALKVYWPGLNLRFFGAFPHLDVPAQPGQVDMRKVTRTEATSYATITNVHAAAEVLDE